VRDHGGNMLAARDRAAAQNGQTDWRLHPRVSPPSGPVVAHTSSASALRVTSS
jgi:hypothetical protein